MKGDRYCQLCGAFIGNYLQDDYYALLHRKYCDSCGVWKSKRDIAFNSREYRRRQRAVRKAKDKLLGDLIEENKQLRKMLIDKGV